MSGWQLSLILKPLIAIVIMAAVVFLAVKLEWIIKRFVPEGKIKRILLFRWKV